MSSVTTDATGTMSDPPGSRARPVAPPAVDEGNTSVSGQEVLSYLKPFPGRLANTLRITIGSLLVLVVGEIFRLPELFMIAYIPIAVFKDDADATTLIAPFALLGVLMSLAASVLIFMAALSDPALRLPLTWLIVFVSMFLMRASSAGQIFLILGLIVIYTQTLGDNVLYGALSGAGYSNNTSYTVPELAFMSPEEALLHNMLYLGLGFMLPAVIVLTINRATMQDPERKLRDALAERFGVVADFCDGREGSRDRLDELAHQGTKQLSSRNELAAKMSRHPHDKEAGAALIEGMSRLTLSLLAWLRVEQMGGAQEDIRALAGPCRQLERAVSEGGKLDGDVGIPDGPPASIGAAAPLVIELRRSLQLIEQALRKTYDRKNVPSKDKKDGGFLKPDAFTNPAYVQFALKLTMTVVVIYLFIELTQWSKISTAIATCFLIALDSVGQSAQRARLRLAGAVVGGALGMASIFVVMPLISDIGGLLCLVAPIVLVGTWIRVGNARIAYFGQQMAFAFMVTTIQDFGPTLDFQTGRDRMIGIFVGEVVLLTVFSSIWPVTVADTIRDNLGKAFEQLAKLMRSGLERVGSDEEAETRRTAAARAFGDAIEAARTAHPDAKLEPKEARDRSVPSDRPSRVIDDETILRIQSLAIPTVVLARSVAHEDIDRRSDLTPPLDRIEAASDVFSRCATWVRTGEGAADLHVALNKIAPANDTPDGPADPDATHEWLGLLQDDLRSLLDGITPEPRASNDRYVVRSSPPPAALGSPAS